jgi:hypothetical protein
MLIRLIAVTVGVLFGLEFRFGFDLLLEGIRARIGNWLSEIDEMERD